MMGFQEYVPLSSYTTFKLGGQARYFSEALTADDVAAIASHAPAPLMVLGGGSNLIFRDGLIERCVMKMALKGFDIVEESADTVALAVGAGEDWDSVVARAVERGWSGLEALSAIPGTAGATPVQNVGAYGREIADVLIEARAYDLLERKPVAISRDDCRFAYRDSIFKQAGSGRFVITAVLLKLSKNKPAIPAYRDIHAYFAERQNLVPSLAEIRQAIIEVRSRKLPDPSVIASAGSFFKNPIVGKEQAEELLKDFPEMVNFPLEDGRVKLAAGWLVEQAGFKGQQHGPIGVYEKNALVLVNRGGGTFSELMGLRDRIVDAVEKGFGVRLEQEPAVV